MNLHRLRVVAAKELFDHVTDRRFLLIAGVLLLVVSIGLIGGLITYKTSIERYASAMGTIGEQATDVRQTAGGSLLVVINSVATQMLFLGAILGIAMGFDRITKEKEGGSLKLLLSHPLFRDEVINGKGLGGLAAIAGLVLVTFVLMVAIMLVFGLVPNGYETFAILVLALITFLLIFSYFSIALLMSTISRTGGTALIAALIVFIALSSLMPILLDSNVTGIFIGKEPVPPKVNIRPMTGSDVVIGDDTSEISDSDENDTARRSIRQDEITRYQQQLRAYSEKRAAIESLVSLFSPTLNFRQVIRKMSVTLSPSASSSIDAVDASEDGGGGSVTPVSAESMIPRVVDSIIPNLVALLVIPSLFFGLSYIRFMRLDVR